jgi:hypothetical protein
VTQPTFAEGPPVPLMVEGFLDPPTLTRLFADLESVTDVMGVREKGGPQEFAGRGDWPLATARDRLLTGTARSIQIRYRFDGHEWTDTIVAAPDGFRVIRCRHQG